MVLFHGWSFLMDFLDNCNIREIFKILPNGQLFLSLWLIYKLLINVKDPMIVKVNHHHYRASWNFRFYALKLVVSLMVFEGKFFNHVIRQRRSTIRSHTHRGRHLDMSWNRLPIVLCCEKMKGGFDYNFALKYILIEESTSFFCCIMCCV